MCKPPKIRFGTVGRLTFSEALGMGWPLNIVMSHMKEDKELSAELTECFKKAYNGEFADGLRISDGVDYSRIVDNLFTDDIYGKMIWSLFWKTHSICDVNTMEHIANIEFRIEQLVSCFG